MKVSLKKLLKVLLGSFLFSGPFCFMQKALNNTDSARENGSC